jgi:hypothetical protein
VFALQANEPSQHRKYTPFLPHGGPSPQPSAPALAPALMNVPRFTWCQFRNSGTVRPLSRGFPNPPVSRCPPRRHVSQSRPQYSKQPADDPNFMSIVDNPPTLVRAGKKKHGPGLIVLGSQPRIPSSPMFPNASNSSHPRNGLCARNLAGPAPRLEVETHSQI